MGSGVTSADFVIDEWVFPYLRWWKAEKLAQHGQAEST